MQTPTKGTVWLIVSDPGWYRMGAVKPLKTTKRIAKDNRARCIEPTTSPNVPLITGEAVEAKQD
jgi:hypothetical protein